MDRESGHNVASADIELVGETRRDCCGGQRRVRSASFDRPRHRRERLSRIGHRDRAPGPRPRCPRAGAAIKPPHEFDPADTVCEGDLLDRASLAAALKGARFLFHAAADYRLWSRDPDEIRRNNVEGTRLIMEEALRAGVERVVYTSSVATLKLTDRGAATEDAPLPKARGLAPTSAARSRPSVWLKRWRAGMGCRR